MQVIMRQGIMGEKPVMGSLKSLAQGFLVATGLIWIFNIAALFEGGDAWLGLMYLLILLIPASSLTYLKLKNTNPKIVPETSEKWRNLLFSFQGVALAFWMFDIVTTFYAINVTGLAIELNPLARVAAWHFRSIRILLSNISFLVCFAV